MSVTLAMASAVDSSFSIKLVIINHTIVTLNKQIYCLTIVYEIPIHTPLKGTYAFRCVGLCIEVIHD